MDYKTLRNMDLNLLVVLDVLLDEASVTKASKRLGLTQSAASHALSRLRSTFDDPLLVRVGTTMQPTPRAETLRKDLRRLLSSVRRFMDDEDTFDARTTTKTFTVRIQDSLQPMLGAIAQRINSEAPNCNFKVHLADYSRMGEVAANEVLITIVPMSLQLQSGLTRIHMGKIRWSVLMRKQHPALEDWGLESWAKWPQLAVSSSRASTDYVDKKAGEAGVKRKITTTVSQFMMALPIIRNSDLLFTNFLQCDISLLQHYGLERRTVPLPLTLIPFGLVWASHLDKDASRLWFSNLLLSSYQEFFGGFRIET